MLDRLFGRGTTTDAISLSLDELFDVCRVERRRHAIDIMADVDDVLRMRTLVEEVTAREFGESATSDQRTTVYTTFYQQHISVLEDADVLSAPGGASGMLHPERNAELIAGFLDDAERAVE